MKKVIMILSAMLLCIPATFGQFILKKESFGIDTNDIKARTNHRLDGEGNPAAILKIQIPLLSDAQISSPNMVDQEYTPGEFIVYLAAGSKRVSIKHPDFEEFRFSFDDPLKEKTVYKLVLKVPEDYLSRGEVPVKISTNVVKATLDVNGEAHATDNGQFLFRLKKGSYPYTLSTQTVGYQPLQGTLEVTEEDAKLYGRIDNYIELQSQKNSNLHIANAEGSVIRIDGKEIGKTKGAISLPRGRHYVDVALGGFTKSFMIDLVNDNEHLDADIRVPLTIVSPSTGEFTIQPLDNAMKPSATKFKAGQPVKVLGNYRVVGKVKGYDESTFEVSAYPDMSKLNMSVPMISKAHHLYYGSPGVKMDRIKAMKEYQKLTDKNDELAMWEFGKILIDQNEHERGQALIRRAADKDQPDAADYMARLLPMTESVKKRSYAEKAIAGGKQSAYEILGYLDASVPPVDYNKAMSELTMYNSPYSRLLRASIAIDNPDLPTVDFSEILDLLESIEPTDEYFKKAQWLLGQMAYNGYGMPKNIDKAISYWSKAEVADLSQNAIMIMAMANLNSESYLQHYINYIDFPSIKTDQVGYKGISIIEFLTSAGRKFDKDNSGMSFRLFSKAYDLGDRSQNTLTYLGKYYKEGKGTFKNLRKAKELLQTAIDKHGDVRSMRLLGNIYEDEKNLSIAEELYRKAIEKNDDISKGYLGTLLYNKGKEYYPQAVELWTEAATKANHKSSIKNLVTYYQKVEKNPSKANMWRNKL